MEIEDVLDKLNNVKKTTKGWTALCPAHDDKNNSLAIHIGQNGKPLLYCFAGCKYEDIVKKLTIDNSQLTIKADRSQEKEQLLITNYELPITAESRRQTADRGTERMVTQSNTEKTQRTSERSSESRIVKYLEEEDMRGFGFDDKENLVFHITYLGVKAEYIKEKSNLRTMQNNAVFVYKDKEGKEINAKIVEYDIRGHRNKDKPPYYLKKFSDGYRVSFFNEDKIRDNNNIVIVEAEKTAVFMEHVLDGYCWIALGGSAMIENKNYELLKDKNVVVIPDYDDAGYKSMIRISDVLDKNNLNFQAVDLSDLTDMPLLDKYDIVDVLDDAKAKGELLDEVVRIKIRLDEALKNCSCKIDFTEINSMQDLMNSVSSKENYLAEKIFQKNGVGGIVGIPDSGKTQFMKFFCLNLIYESDLFLGFKLKPKHKKTLFITTEDSPEQIVSSTKKQNDEMMSRRGMDDRIKNFYVEFADTLTNEEVVRKINNFLMNHKIDLIVVDSLGDIFGGTDANSATQVRNFLKQYSKIATQFNVLIIFIHHIAKSQYKKEAEHGQVLGSSAIVQKMRFVMDLRPERGNMNRKQLFFTKGNYIESSIKESGFIVNMDENSLCFDFTGERIAVKDLVVDTSDKLCETYIIKWEEVFEGRDVMQLVDIAFKLKEIYGMSKTTAYKKIKETRDEGQLIEIAKRNFKLNKNY